MAAKSVTTTDVSGSFFTALPDDLLQRVLVGVPLDDHCVAASVCQAFRGVITDLAAVVPLQRVDDYARLPVLENRVLSNHWLDLETQIASS